MNSVTRQLLVVQRECTHPFIYICQRERKRERGEGGGDRQKDRRTEKHIENKNHGNLVTSLSSCLSPVTVHKPDASSFLNSFSPSLLLPKHKIQFFRQQKCELHATAWHLPWQSPLAVGSQVPMMPVVHLATGPCKQSCPETSGHRNSPAVP